MAAIAAVTDQPARSARTPKPARTEKPARTDKPARTQKPARTEKPARTQKPAPATAAVEAAASVPVAPVPVAPAPVRRRQARTRPSVAVALGSLTQPGARTGGGCARCGSDRVTSLTLTLTDGTPVSFTSCHGCEHRTWVGPEGDLDRETVLARTRKER